ncbi:MAG: hypothetical protein MHM6MM_005038 [Cercozoa sp. M6MM]
MASSHTLAHVDQIVQGLLALFLLTLAALQIKQWKKKRGMASLKKLLHVFQILIALSIFARNIDPWLEHLEIWPSPSFGLAHVWLTLDATTLMIVACGLAYTHWFGGMCDRADMRSVSDETFRRRASLAMTLCIGIGMVVCWLASTFVALRLERRWPSCFFLIAVVLAETYIVFFLIANSLRLRRVVNMTHQHWNTSMRTAALLGGPAAYRISLRPPHESAAQLQSADRHGRVYRKLRVLVLLLLLGWGAAASTQVWQVTLRLSDLEAPLPMPEPRGIIWPIWSFTLLQWFFTFVTVFIGWTSVPCVDTILARLPHSIDDTDYAEGDTSVRATSTFHTVENHYDDFTEAESETASPPFDDYEGSDEDYSTVSVARY